MFKKQDPQGPTTKSQEPRSTGSDNKNYKIQDAVLMKYRVGQINWDKFHFCITDPLTGGSR